MLSHEKCQKLVCNSKNGRLQVVQSEQHGFRVSRNSDPPFHCGFCHLIRSVFHSFTHLFIHVSPQRRQQSLLSCYSNELLKPPPMNNSAAENGGRMSVCVCGRGLPLLPDSLSIVVLHEVFLPATSYLMATFTGFNDGDFARHQVLDFRLV